LTFRTRIYSILAGLRRLPAILLLFSVATLGSGALRYVHELDHIAAHSRASAAGADGHGHGHARDDQHHSDRPGHEHHAPEGEPADDAPDHHHHDPAHGPAGCFIHSQLNLPLHDAGYVPVLVCVGRFVPAPGALPAPAVRSRRPGLLLDSRGPPARLVPPLPIVV